MKILLVEADRSLRISLRQELKRRNYVVASASTRAQADGLLRRGRVEIILLATGLSDGSGLELLSSYRAAGGLAGTIALVERADPRDRIEALESGADGVLVKPFDTDELVARIRAIARRPRQPASELFRLGPLTVDCQRRVAELAGEPIDVTATEFQLLRELIRRPDQPAAREDLTELLWPGQRLDASASASLSVHVSNLREKLAAAGSPVTIRARRRVGYQVELRSASSGGD